MLATLSHDCDILNILVFIYYYYTVWWVTFVGFNFHGKSEKALKINLRGFKFRDSNQSRGVALLHKR